MRIESIIYDERKKRFTFTMENRETFAVSVEKYADWRLKTGDEITGDELERLRREDERVRGEQIALRYLSYAERTEQEVRNRLRRDRIGAREIDQILEKLVRLGLIDDRAFAEQYALDRAEHRKWGRRRITEELRAKGVSRELIREAVSQIAEEDERDAIDELLDTKYRQRDFSDEREFRRVYAALLRRGFSSEEILRRLKKRRAES